MISCKGCAALHTKPWYKSLKIWEIFFSCPILLCSFLFLFLPSLCIFQTVYFFKQLPVLCSCFWLLCPEVKQPSRLPVIFLCLASVTKRRLSCWHASPPSLATQNRSIAQKSNSLIQMQLHVAYQLCTATATFPGTQSTVLRLQPFHTVLGE